MPLLKSFRSLKIIAPLLLLLGALTTWADQAPPQVFPDGTPLSDWFLDKTKIDLSKLGTKYSITEHGAVADGKTLNTEAIQRLIDKVATSTGGVIVVPKGTFLTGALFFKPNTHLHVQEGGILKGSDDIKDYPKQASRMEGQNLDYFPALVNAYHTSGFTITGTGTIDGNGGKFWERFWAIRKEKKNCTNLEVSRPRLVFIWGSDHVSIQDIHLKDSGFWTTHFYKCNYVRIIDAKITAPRGPVKAASSDAIDLDVCSNVVVRGCYMAVCDDGIALKGGKGPYADTDPNNGANTNILIEDCTFGFCYSALTCGSESIHNRNILLRNCTLKNPSKLLHLKMRTDTPQIYEQITVENIKGTAKGLLHIHPYSQFHDLKGRETPPASIAQNITLRNISVQVDDFASIELSDGDALKNFTLENIQLEARNTKFDQSRIDGLTIKNVTVNGKALPNR